MAKQSRPPVVAILGHVDHGKTSLLDYIRKAKVAAGEAGGITQHIGAYQAEHNGKKITFIDTPGHAAFSKMRSRGAQATDFVVLVVAANDGVKPQTIESIQHIKAANVPFIVAINKIDLPEASPEMVKAQLTEHEVFVQGYGGGVEVVEVSGKTGKGVDNLLDTLLLMAEVEEISADPEAPLHAVVIESVKDARTGVEATVLIKEGTLRERDELHTLTVKGKVRRMTDAVGRIVKVAEPGMPVEVLGFEDIPMVGEVVTTTPQDPIKAAELQRAAFDPSAFLGEQAPKLKLILKSDTVGTLQAITQQLSDEVILISSGVGGVTEGDILQAEATGALIMGFNVPFSKSLKGLADEHGVKVRTYKIIYELLESLQKRILKLIEPTIDEEVIGEAEVLQIFVMKGETIAGSKVTKGEIKKTDLIHLKRDDKIVADPKIKTMRHGKDEIEKVKVGDECGIVFTRFSNLQVGDKIIAYVVKED